MTNMSDRGEKAATCPAGAGTGGGGGSGGVAGYLELLER